MANDCKPRAEMFGVVWIWGRGLARGVYKVRLGIEAEGTKELKTLFNQAINPCYQDSKAGATLETSKRVEQLFGATVRDAPITYTMRMLRGAKQTLAKTRGMHD